jgi:hypothetical protein
MANDALPDEVARLLWDVDARTIDLDRDRALVFERVMTRGTWTAMRWLRSRYSDLALRSFVESRGAEVLSPRDCAYWSVVCGLDSHAEPGGGRPRWADDG